MIVNQMFNFTPPHCEYVVNGVKLIFATQIGGAHVL